jgi:hypothetical protein
VGVVLAGGCIVSLSLVRGVPAAVCGAVVSVPAGCVFAAGWCLLYSWLVLAAVPAAEGR